MTQIDFQTWVDTYKPILNPGVQTSYFDGYFIATLKEVENYLESKAELGPDNVWSIAKSSEKTGQILSGLYEEAEGEIFGYFICQAEEVDEKVASFPQDHRLWNEKFIFQVDDASGKYRFGNYGKRTSVSPPEKRLSVSYQKDDGSLLSSPDGQAHFQSAFREWAERYDLAGYIEAEHPEDETAAEAARFVVEELDAHFVWTEEQIVSSETDAWVTPGNSGENSIRDSGIWPAATGTYGFYLSKKPWRNDQIEIVISMIRYRCEVCNESGDFDDGLDDECQTCDGVGWNLFYCDNLED